MLLLKRLRHACLRLLPVLAAGLAQAQVSDGVVRIGLITDLSGPYADIDGMAGVEAVRMAVSDSGGSVLGSRIEVLYADHFNQPERAAATAREWIEQRQLDLLIGGTHSGASLAMAEVAREKKRPFIVVGAATPALTNEQCSRYTVHYAYDTVALARGTAQAILKAGGRSWHFLTADYAFGEALQRDTSQVVRNGGGNVLGSTRHPLGTTDFLPYLQPLQHSPAQVLALANAGNDAILALRTAQTLGLHKRMRMAGLLMFINDVHTLGLPAAQGLLLTDSWYWNQTPETRAWSRRFHDRVKRMPSSLQAADYSAALQYLGAVKSAGTDDPDRVLERLRQTKLNDMYVRGGYIRSDGRMVHDMYLMQVKTPAQSNEPWDYYLVMDTLKGEAAWTPRSESRCRLWQ